MCTGTGTQSIRSLLSIVFHVPYVLCDLHVHYVTSLIDSTVSDLEFRYFVQFLQERQKHHYRFAPAPRAMA